MDRKRIYKGLTYILSIISVFAFIVFIARNMQINQKIVATNADVKNIESLSNNKIGWGIKREDNHKQPDVGSTNKKILDKYDGYCLGNAESKKVYLTFDEGYEAGYTEKILDVLKENNVKACFFITAHYANSKPDLVQKMIDEGHIIGNHTPNCLMSGVVA